jgi:stearoyl-CoA desaturase (delta-9 desaturase)
MKLWNESSNNIFYSNIIRILLCLHFTWCINSFAHYIGDKPYNTNIKASNNNLLGILTLGEGWHNYHHSYPKDYQASEKNKFNITTWFINLTKYFGLSSNHYIKDIKNIPNSERFNLDYYKLLS